MAAFRDQDDSARHTSALSFVEASAPWSLSPQESKTKKEKHMHKKSEVCVFMMMKTIYFPPEVYVWYEIANFFVLFKIFTNF